jgi:hypothetical protein
MFLEIGGNKSLEEITVILRPLMAPFPACPIILPSFGECVAAALIDSEDTHILHARPPVRVVGGVGESLAIIVSRRADRARRQQGFQG